MSDFEQKTEEKSDVADKPQNFGAWLKGQRMAKKVALEEIAAVTKIHIQQLRSLEDGWEGTMPASAFVRGFVVSYARHLNLNEAEVLEKFQAHSHEFKERSVQVRAPQQQTYTANSGKPLRFGSYSERKDQLKLTHWVSTKRILYALGVILGFVLLIFLMKLGHKASEVVPVNPSEAVSTDVNNPQPQSTQIVDKSTIAPGTLFVGTPPFDFTLSSVGDVWINLKVDENSLESFKLGKSESRKIVFNRKAVLTLSNTSLLSLVIGGKNYKIAPPAQGTSNEKLILPEQSSRLITKE